MQVVNVSGCTRGSAALFVHTEYAEIDDVKSQLARIEGNCNDGIMVSIGDGLHAGTIIKILLRTGKFRTYIYSSRQASHDRNYDNLGIGSRASKKHR